MGRRIAIYMDEELVEALDEHTRESPLSRSELVMIAVRRFLRDERRRAHVPKAGAHVARRIAKGEVPSRVVDGRRAGASGAPWGN